MTQRVRAATMFDSYDELSDFTSNNHILSEMWKNCYAKPWDIDLIRGFRPLDDATLECSDGIESGMCRSLL